MLYLRSLITTFLALAATTSTLVYAHGAGESSSELAARNAHVAHARRSLEAYLPCELTRPDIRESGPGVDLLLDIQAFDISTCTTLPSITLDIWGCNSTAVYTGFAVEGTLGETYLRGLSPADESGVVQFTAEFPGHYNGRATHIHIVAHTNGTVLQQWHVRRWQRAAYRMGVLPAGGHF
ncbi:aromatic compound dioxygenase [Choiromyces venosus 120613-1]|uniref:Aromatic compound dioxygenase n=1 Tax=Choiromyces venosus 120613-1 TaxID=1336337 RepID=A0A3N4JA54_9PEZI|nr:aromatic compound dioxygenase [Choiromyces venosus 120613-1]